MLPASETNARLLDLKTRWDAALEAFPPGPIAVLCHSDADGLSAGAILTRSLRQAGLDVYVDVTRKGESAWSEGVRARLEALQPAGLIVADLGSREEPILPDVPTILIDHHRPTGAPPNAVLLTGYELDPVPTSGLLAYWLTSASDLEWVASISILSDLGDKAPFAELEHARKQFGSTRLRDATSLLNAPRRTGSGDAAGALRLLLQSESPSDLLEAEELRLAKAEVAEALESARRAAPKIAGPVALLRMHTSCQVHPLIAQMWRARLRKNIVLAANSGYLTGRVNFAMRTANGTNLLDFLAKHRPANAGEEYGRGHDGASGGSLAFDDWNEFAMSLGFGAEARVNGSAGFPR